MQAVLHIQRCIAFFISLFIALSATGQTVTNVRTTFDQSKQLMLIRYDLTGLGYKQEIQITPRIASRDTTFPQMKSLTGDFGWMTRGGKNRLIVWEPFRDGITSLQYLGIDLKTTVRNALVDRFWGLVVQGSNSAPLGLKVLRLSPIGFFGGFRVGNLPPSYDYTVTNAGVINYLESGVYEIGSTKRLASYAITGGPIFQVSRRMYAYAGIGYGVEQLFWQYQVYNLEKTPIKSQWALNENINRQGIVGDVGAVFRLRHLLIDVGVSTIEFKTVQITAGLGFAFSNNQKPQ
jgi:hypothetical protein